MKKIKNPVQAARFYAFLRNTLGIYLKRSFLLTLTNKNTFDPPYILLGNHVTSFDPFIMAYGINHPINYVTSDAFFRNPLLRFFLNRLGCIPKTKFMSDSTAARAMLNVKKNGGIVGIFPEGARSWDGHVLPLVYSTAKLVKLLKIDVVTAKLEGAMFVMPRWSRYRKKGPTYLSYKKILDASQIQDLDIAAIYEILSNALYYDEYEFQQKHMNAYKGKRRAEHIERFLYVCPACSTFNSIRSSNDKLYCDNCLYTVSYNETGFFSGEDVIFDDIRKWSVFQQNKTLELISGSFDFKAEHVSIYTGSKGSFKLRSLKQGTLRISENMLSYTDSKNQSIGFDPDKMTGLNIQSNHKLEFYQENVLYKLDFAKSNISAYAIKKIISGIGKERGFENG